MERRRPCRLLALGGLASTTTVSAVLVAIQATEGSRWLAVAIIALAVITVAGAIVTVVVLRLTLSVLNDERTTDNLVRIVDAVRDPKPRADALESGVRRPRLPIIVVRRSTLASIHDASDSVELDQIPELEEPPPESEQTGPPTEVQVEQTEARSARLVHGIQRPRRARSERSKNRNQN
jgi:hypothetical protein